MRGRMGSEWRQTVSRVALIGVIGGLSGACSADMARFSEPFSNPFATAQMSAEAEPTRTGSIAAPTEKVEARPLAAPRVAAVPAAPPGPAVPPARQAVVSVGPGGWTTQGGATVTVGPGDSLAGLSDRYGVPTAAILSANGLAAAQVTAGRRIVIPVYNAAGAAQRTRVASLEPVVSVRPAAKLTEAAKPAAPKAEGPAAKPDDAKKHVRPGQPRADEPRPAPAKVEPAKPQAKLLAKAAEPAKTVKVEAAKVVRTEPLKTPKPEAAKLAKTEPPKADPKPEPKVAKAEPPAAKPEPVRIARIEAGPVPKPEPVKVAPPAPKEPEPQAAGPAPAATPSAEFRWPARGRVITGFGAGGGNEGINIAVPEGTPVKSAESGTVAYAGSEVKGYGNLVLIRHDNGYVSAYAHNGEVKVKRGEKVGRGQVIAKSGQTGNVTSPQLHFEIRKGSTPVDPMTHLASQ
jgi:murein DD-endopeptidase MepM/ murein hydrolase activator NlpD